MSSWASCAVLLYLVLFLTPSCPILFLVTALPGNYLAADASTSWTNSLSAPDSVKFDDGSFARIILLSNFSNGFAYGAACGCGFICNQTCNSHLFAIFSLSYDNDVNISKSDGPKVVWSANPENPVSINATLRLTSEKGLVLKDANGTTVWSTNIFSKSVAGLNLTDTCNLQLLDDKSATVWQSFDHPTDTLVVGQKLVPGQQLTSQGRLFSFSVTRQGLFAYINSNPPQRYFTYTFENTRIFTLLFWKKENVDEAEEYYLDHIPGMPTRYSYDDLQAITENFNKELGVGGFGTVFEGTLPNGTKVAVKRLDGFSQIKKSFLAEVETIGSIHHINLVRLIGFCAEKYHMLLVYEYMSNGSLDRWIFHKNPEMLLDWQHRKKIVLEIARGLTYLHEDCRQKIVHLDIKPHNILLDGNFNAKVSDFGLSKLVDHDQSQVVTNMRGTPGYMAPEWLSSVITEKVDVYSFGVVLLEILCGRRNIDRSQPEEAMHLLDLFRKNIVEDRLLDLVDKCSEDMQLHGGEVVNMMRVAAWCLQNDFTRRPSMSMVVKALEGAVNVESDLDYFFSNPSLPNIPNMRVGVENQEVHIVAASSLFPSILSGPR
nr:g-type lectin s-receptor-like serine/threonine-protein kinase sd2-5 [Quercus suber]